MEKVMETLATGMGRTIGFAAKSGLLFAIFAILWLGFGIGVVWSQGSVDAAWAWVRALPIVVQLVVWILFLPVMIGMWIWETSWPFVLRVLLVIGVAGWNLLVFLPRAMTAKP
jgi:hypothetical protein